MSKESKTYIVSCINGVPLSDAISDYGAWIASKSKQPLKLLYTINQNAIEADSDLSGSIGLGARAKLLEELVDVDHQQNKLANRRAKIVLEAAKTRLESVASIDTVTSLRNGRFIENLMELENEISLLVIGRYGQKHFDQNDEETLGHKVEAVVRRIQKPVLIVSKPFVKPTKVLLCFDGSDAAKKALQFMVEHPMFEGVHVHVVYAGEQSDASVAFLSSAQKSLESNNRLSELAHLAGEAKDAISTYLLEQELDMLVMGAFGHHWIHDLLMGSFTSKMLTQTRMPLLMVR